MKQVHERPRALYTHSRSVCRRFMCTTVVVTVMTTHTTAHSKQHAPHNFTWRPNGRTERGWRETKTTARSISRSPSHIKPRRDDGKRPPLRAKSRLKKERARVLTIAFDCSDASFFPTAGENRTREFRALKRAHSPLAPIHLLALLESLDCLRGVLLSVIRVPSGNY